MAGGEALHLALALHRQPALNAECRSQALPSDVIEVLRIAAGHAEAIAAASAATGNSAEELREAARFFVEQQLLARESESDPWRVLGVQPGSDAGQIREHRRLLVGLVHPDRSADWEAAYSDRVNRAWKALKTPESREAIEALRASSNRDDSTSSVSSLGDWDAEVDSRSRVPSVKDAQDCVPAEARSTHSTSPHRSSALGAGAVVAVLALVVGWGIFSDGLSGDEVLVPMGEPAPAARAASSLPNSAEGMATPMSQTSPPETAESLAMEAAHLPMPPATESNNEPGSMLTTRGESAATNATAATGSGQLVSSDELTTRPVPPTARIDAGLLNAGRQTDLAEAKLDSADRATPKVDFVEHSEVENTNGSNSIRVTANVTPDPVVPSSGGSVANDDDDRRETKPIASREPPQVAQSTSPPPEAATAASAKSLADPAPEATAAALAPPLPVEELAAAAQPPVASTPKSVTSDDESRIASSVDVESLLASFSRSYALGDLNALVGLFSRRANSANGGSLALAADYARLFDTTSDRSIVVSELAWREEAGTLRGQGSFEARYRKEGRLFKQVVGGTLQFVIVEEAGQLRLLRLDSSGASANL